MANGGQAGVSQLTSPHGRLRIPAGDGTIGGVGNQTLPEGTACRVATVEGLAALLPLAQAGWGRPEMIIRPGIMADIDGCRSLVHSYVTDHVWQMQVQESGSHVGITFQEVRLPRHMNAQYPRDLEQLVESLQREGGFFVAEVDGEVRGYVDLAVQPWRRMVRVVNLAVDEGYRRRGIATALLRHARRWATENGAGAMLAEMTTKNHPAISFFRELGFQFCGFNDHYYTNQDIALFFVQMLR
jgi:ribosomal protein S18 acetylase RimI-like enzyme